VTEGNNSTSLKTAGARPPGSRKDFCIAGKDDPVSYACAMHEVGQAPRDPYSRIERMVVMIFRGNTQFVA
jgi:hypothetical protein